MESAVHAHGLTKAFGNRKAVDRLSFDLPRGSFLTVLGPNGAGKTTLLRLLSTLERPSAGSLTVCGVDAVEEPEELRAKVGLISHQPMLYPDLTAQENLEFFARLHGVADPADRALELLDAVGLKARRMDRVGTFSRGMTQRVSIARALVNDPELVLLDEPCSGLDPHGMQVFARLMEQVREDRTFVMVSHDVEQGLDMADHVLVMSRGRAVQFCPAIDVDRGQLADLYAGRKGGAA
ncbi:MAG: ABC transporter ATP-binding protein [Coriobacteriia bacterium]|nr:ABC transporter ATP-binding protein [Coriobacteriia bacterium]